DATSPLVCPDKPHIRVYRPRTHLSYVLNSPKQSPLRLGQLALVQPTPLSQKRPHLRAAEDRAAVRVEVAQVGKRLVVDRQQRLDYVEGLWRPLQLIAALVLQY